MEELLKVENLKVHFHNAAADRFAVDGISFALGPGEILGIVGESGSGKTVTAMSISGLLPKEKTDVGGEVRFCGRDILHCDDKTLLSLQGQDISLVFQEPLPSMDPLMRIGPQVEESLRVHTKLSRAERKRRALNALKMAELSEVETIYKKYPHQLSGGQLQRVMIAAAIINGPKLLIADEPTTALDVSVQAEILELLKKLNRESGTAIVFISHDLRIIRRLCDSVLVMQHGKIVERGSAEELFTQAKHEYTRQLIAAIPDRSKRLV